MGASSQPESNENPITAHETREYFSFFFRAVPEALGMLFFFSLQLQSRPPTPLKKREKLEGDFLLLFMQQYSSNPNILKTGRF